MQACLFDFPFFALAQRQSSPIRVFLRQMDTPNLHVQLTVEEVLQKWPGAFSVFMAVKTKCPGCFMQQFCRLKDVAETYQISLPDLMRDLKDYVQSLNHNQRNIL